MALVMAALLSLSLVGGAAAAPVNNPHAETFEGECDGDAVTVVVTSGQPGFIVGSTERLIPAEFTIEGTFTPEVGDPVDVSETETVGKGKKLGLQDDLITCTFEVSFEEPGEGTFEGTITVQVFRTPRGSAS